jgi:hypothetical protein
MKTTKMLLRIYNPIIHFDKDSKLNTNFDAFPDDIKLLYAMYWVFDMGVLHACKKFNISQLIDDITSKEILSYLRPNETSLRKAKNFYIQCFYRDLFYLEHNVHNEYTYSTGNDQRIKLGRRCVDLKRFASTLPNISPFL